MDILSNSKYKRAAEQMLRYAEVYIQYDNELSAPLTLSEQALALSALYLSICKIKGCKNDDNELYKMFKAIYDLAKNDI